MFLRNINKRIKILFILLVSMLLLVVLKVLYIELFQHNKLSSLANDLWSRNLVLKADRGKILDRNGVVLADNLTTASLVLVPNQIKDKERVTRDLSRILNSDIRKHVYKKTSIERVHPEGRRLSYEIAEKINNLHYDGVYLVKESKRYYPNGKLLAHALGYVGIDNQGLSGLELEYDKYLKGEDGTIKYFSDAHGNRINLNDIYVAPTSGMNINLTIDIKIQKSLEREMNNIKDMFNPDMALAVVVKPKTGEILGMSSLPSYDPNNYSKYSSEVLSRNLPIWASYEPGSTFKIVVPVFM
ncbi:MAG: hypothetical protein IKE63_04520 [Bacilli bacterium]|nr:hypothetical protein [Bacilli bacterium]